MKHIDFVPQVTNSSSFTSQEFTTNSIPHESSLTSTSPSQTASSVELNNQKTSSVTFLPHSSYSKDHSTNVEGSATNADEPNLKDTNNYFTQFQTQVSPSSNSSTIPMFSVKNFPQMSPLAQPLGKSFLFNLNREGDFFSKSYLCVYILSENYFILKSVFIYSTDYFILCQF